MTKLSFIVPIYNVEQYLRKCVESLIKQNYSNYEIILVDDGSTDGSGALCDTLVRELKIEDRRLKNIQLRVLHQVNGGLSAARNAGLKAAKGEYVCFVDSDDYWEENMLGALMEQVEREKLDVLRFDYRNVRLVKNEGMNGLMDERKYEVFEPNKTPRYIDRGTEVVDGETYMNERMSYACYSVMYIMRREIVPIFTEGIHFEDTEWIPRMMLGAKRVNSTITIVYNYLVRQGSITKVEGDVDKVRKNVEDCIKIIAQYNRYIAQYPNCLWLRNMRSSMVVSVCCSIAQYLYARRNEYISQLESMRVFPLTLANQGKTYSRKARLINISPRLAVKLLHFKNGK